MPTPDEQMNDELERLERERRANHALRNLIDEMLQRVRLLHRNTVLWDPADRAQAEAELAEIMARVRLEASRGVPEADPAPRGDSRKS